MLVPQSTYFVYFLHAVKQYRNLLLSIAQPGVGTVAINDSFLIEGMYA